MAVKPLRVGVVGSGIISGIYLENMIHRFDILEVAAVGSAHMEHAQRRADEFGIPARSFEEMLADDSIDMIVNLTPAPAHEALIRRALEAGKHVYTEKTMTLDHASARALLELARSKGLYLGSAPDTFLGSALQTARLALDDNRLGEITSFAMAGNRDNAILTSFFRFLNLPGGGAAYDYLVYYLTALCSLLGPVKQVAAMVDAPNPTHLDINPKSDTYGQQIPTPNESRVCATLRMASGVTGTVHLNNDSVCRDETYFAVYGSKGIMYLPDPNGFDGDVVCQPNWGVGEEPAARAVLESPFEKAGNCRGIGPADMAYALLSGRPARADGGMACHVLEVIDAIIESGKTGRFVDIHSDFQRPEPRKPFAASLEESIR